MDHGLRISPGARRTVGPGSAALRRSRLSALGALAALLGVLSVGAGLPETQAGFDEGLRAYRATDYAAALAEFQPLADAGDAQAQFYLGYMYERGQGLEASVEHAVAWYAKAAEQGVAGAQFNLGLAYEQGRGVEADAATALLWLTRAAEQGNLRAQYKVAEMYESGIGTEKNLVRAHLWFNLAGKKRHEDAKKRRHRVAKAMTPYEIAEAEMLARHWKQARKQP